MALAEISQLFAHFAMTKFLKKVSQLLIISSFLADQVNVYAIPLSNKDKKIIEQYNGYIEDGREYLIRYKNYNDSKLPICEFASWHPNSPEENCITLWTGWCWVSKSPQISVYDRPNGNTVNALKNGRLLSPEDEAGSTIPILIANEYYQVPSWTKVFGPYQNQYRYWGWVKRAELECEP